MACWQGAANMDEKEATPPGVLETLRRTGATMLGIFQNRLELFAVELQEERLHLIEALLLIAAIVALGFFTLALAAAGVIVLLWSTFGVAILFILSGIGLVGTLLVAWRLRERLKDWPFLSGTLAELKKDREWLEKK